MNNISDICMSRKLTLPQLKKYDITQKVIEALADSESRAILFSIIKKGNTAAELSDKLKIPLSSVYKKLTDLEELTLIEVEKWMLSDKGRKYKVYRSRISKADISIRKPEPTLTLIPN
jgi:predicted ArsR family transcriptional regulator